MEEDDLSQVALPRSKPPGPRHGNICHACGGMINGLGRIDSQGEFVFHPECFKCAECDDLFPMEVITIKWNYRKEGPLVDRSEPRFPLHQQCWQKIKSEIICQACSQPIWLPSSDRVNRSGLLWHENCFRCSNCGEELDRYRLPPELAEDEVPHDTPFIRDGKVYCKGHGREPLEPEDLTEQIMFDENQYPPSGGSCVIYSGRYQGKRVALRALGGWPDERAVKRFRSENVFWFNLPKPRNVLPLLGICADPKNPGRQCGVHPWAEHGELSDLVRERPDLDKVGLLIGAARGLDYLHSSSIIHGDIKGRNILIDSEGVALVADLGTARFIGNNTRTHREGTDGFMAPELENLLQKKTPASDVFAFGKTIIQILCGGQLPSGPDDPIIREFVNTQRYLGAWAVAKECCEANPEKRPKMALVIKKLEDLGPAV